MQLMGLVNKQETVPFCFTLGHIRAEVPKNSKWMTKIYWRLTRHQMDNVSWFVGYMAGLSKRGEFDAKLRILTSN